MSERLREAAVAICRLWFTDNAPDGSQHLRKAMLDLRDALDAFPATPAAGACYKCSLYAGTDQAPPPHDHPDATPDKAASGHVEAAWNALLWDVGDTQGREAVIARHRPLIEAAIRAERGDVTIRDALAFDAGVPAASATDEGPLQARIEAAIADISEEWAESAEWLARMIVGNMRDAHPQDAGLKGDNPHLDHRAWRAAHPVAGADRADIVDRSYADEWIDPLGGRR